MAVRKIVQIDETKCDGCGECIPNCVEGALKVVDGKARMVSEVYCDGLGACLGHCPQDAISVVEREAPEFDEAATEAHMRAIGRAPAHAPAQSAPAHANPFAGCPGSRAMAFEAQTEDAPAAPRATAPRSALRQWPVQLTLVAPGAPYLQDADLLLAADCAAYAYGDFHNDLLRGRALVVACPKLDDMNAHVAKLTEVLQQAQPRSITIARMEVPCCGGLKYMVARAMQAAGADIPVREVVISIRGEKLVEQELAAARA